MQREQEIGSAFWIRCEKSKRDRNVVADNETHKHFFCYLRSLFAKHVGFLPVVSILAHGRFALRKRQFVDLHVRASVDKSSSLKHFAWKKWKNQTEIRAKHSGLLFDRVRMYSWPPFGLWVDTGCSHGRRSRRFITHFEIIEKRLKCGESQVGSVSNRLSTAFRFC